MLDFLRFVTSGLNANHRRQHTKFTKTKQKTTTIVQNAQTHSISRYEYCRSETKYELVFRIKNEIPYDVHLRCDAKIKKTLEIESIYFAIS